MRRGARVWVCVAGVPILGAAVSLLVHSLPTASVSIASTSRTEWSGVARTSQSHCDPHSPRLVSTLYQPAMFVFHRLFTRSCTKSWECSIRTWLEIILREMS
ncbi:hypothetical protein ANN_05017 [Periplaneta americana]|uniref:Secreted protein n=1 Tax=Periplaneta americana TaxID=6978 RepID=A0ABQ8TA24_PERAM|nr:hypothetical protein ANN_05017 [Periplaneta americana]